MPRIPNRRLLSREELAEFFRTGLREDAGAFFIDMGTVDRVVTLAVESIIVSRKSPFQQIDIFRTPHFGLMLALDGIVQVAESDEHLYHELLIHPGCALLPTVGSALVLGGGDGCAARELLKYRELENLHVIEVDQMVVDLCRIHFKEINAGALDDRRTWVTIQEAESFLRENPTLRYDLVVADLTEPYDLSGQAGDLSRHIFSTAFYEFLKDRLTPGGILVVQTGGLTYVPQVDRHHKSIIEVLRGSFKTVETAYQYVHSFDQIWSITLASDHPHDVSGLDPDPVLRDKGIERLKHYDRLSHVAAFQPPRHIREFT